MNQGGSMPKVLIAEDEPLARWMLLRTLEDAGWQVIEAASCGQTVELLSGMNVDLIVSDHRLPDGFGVDVVSKLRKQGRRDPVIYLTAEAETVSEETRTSLDLAAVLSKPLNVDELKEAIARLPDFQTLERPETGAPPEHVGRYRLVAAPAVIDRDSMSTIYERYGAEAWLALDARNVEAVAADVVDDLAALAASCRSRGGRLCLMGLADTTAAELRGRGLDGDLDLAIDIADLDALSRRLASSCERKALLNSVIERSRKS